MKYTLSEIQSQREYIDYLEERCERAKFSAVESNTGHAAFQWLQKLLGVERQKDELNAMLLPASD